MILFPGLRPGMRLEQNNTVIRQADSYTWIYIVFAVYHKYVAGKNPPKNQNWYRQLRSDSNHYSNIFDK